MPSLPVPVRMSPMASPARGMARVRKKWSIGARSWAPLLEPGQAKVRVDGVQVRARRNEVHAVWLQRDGLVDLLDRHLHVRL